MAARSISASGSAVLNRVEARSVLDGVVDGGGGQQGVEAATAGRGVVLVEVLAVHDEDALVNALVGLEERRGLEGSERLA